MVRPMRVPESSCQHIADRMLTVLSEKNLIRLRGERKSLVDKVTATLLDNFRQEEVIEKDAERLADEHLRSAPGGVDRRRVVQMIKQRLAEERRFAL
ncbi:MAG: DUF507 family protein [Deltaproteobacteria bacterium]|nr:DUF507 family protein [Deltaproteobacteria bacterium]